MVKVGHNSDSGDSGDGRSPLDAAIAKQEKLRSRLDAEAMVGGSSALIGGFALSLVPEVSNVTSVAAQWVFVCCMSISGALCLLSVVTSGTIYWAGTHLLSATQETVSVENDLFRAFWKQPALKKARRYARRAFQASVPLFLAGIDALIFDYTTSVVMTTIIAVVFAATIVVAAWLTKAIEDYTTRTTATS